jgi:hypothetical protein
MLSAGVLLIAGAVRLAGGRQEVVRAALACHAPLPQMVAVRNGTSDKENDKNAPKA